MLAWVLLAGCAPTLTPDIPLTPNRPELPTELLAPNNIPIGSSNQAVPLTSYRPSIKTSGAISNVEGNGVSLDFADTDIRTVVEEILGQILHLTYTIDPRVKGTATFHTTNTISIAELLPLLQSLLAENGATLDQSGTIYNVVPADGGGNAAGGPSGGNPTLASTIIAPLRYASADGLVNALQPFIGPGGKIAAAPSGNAVIIAGDTETRQTLLSLVTAFDVDTLAGQSYALLPISNGGAKDIATALQTALNGKQSLSNVRIVPLTRIDALLVVANSPEDIENVRRAYDLIEDQQAQGVRSWNVYYLQASQANNLAYVLQQAFTPDDVTAVPDSAKPSSSDNTQPTTTSNNGLGENTGGISSSTINSDGTGNLGTPIGAAPSSGTTNDGTAPSAEASTTNPLLGGLGDNAEGADSDPDRLRIVPDIQNNVLLIYATPSEDNLINTMLAKIDVLPLEVRIDAVIAEVDLNNTLQYGTQFYFKGGRGINGILSNATATLTDPSTAAFNSTFPGFIVGGNGTGGAPFVISALNAVTKVQVLSSPELMVLNNSTAQLQVGSLVPYLTTSSQSTLVNNAPIINSIQYQPTGVIMQVTPRVNQSGLVMLKITQSISSVDNSVVNTTGIESPTFLQRSLSTSVVVQDGQTVGLAGLISDNSSRSNQGIPWLKDIPVLGFLAGSQNNLRTRTELLVLLTPYVVYNQQDARALTEDIQEALPNASAVPYTLSRPPEGNDDPNLPYRPLISP